MDFTQTSSYVYVQNGLTLNGTAEFGQGSGLYFQGTGEQTLDGTGTLHFTIPSSQLYNYSNTLHITSGIVIHGAGVAVGGNQSDSHMTNDGTIDSDAGGTIVVGTTASWTNNGTLRGTGAGSVLQTQGPWSNDGTVELGTGGTMNATTGFTQNAGGELQVDIKGTANSDFGKATVTGAANLGGTLTIVLQNGFVPNIGDTFQIMTFGTTSGSFSTVNGITIGGGKKFDVNVGATSITLEVVAG